MCGSFEIASQHLNGLEQLIKLRGDLKTNPFRKSVEEMIALFVTSSNNECLERFTHFSSG